MTYQDKVEKIAQEDREHARSELTSLAKWLKNRYPSMNFREVNRFLNEMLDVSV